VSPTAYLGSPDLLAVPRSRETAPAHNAAGISGYFSVLM
jgi:hypothetical protein